MNVQLFPTLRVERAIHSLLNSFESLLKIEWPNLFESIYSVSLGFYPFANFTLFITIALSLTIDY